MLLYGPGSSLELGFQDHYSIVKKYFNIDFSAHTAAQIDISTLTGVFHHKRQPCVLVWSWKLLGTEIEDHYSIVKKYFNIDFSAHIENQVDLSTRTGVFRHEKQLYALVWSWKQLKKTHLKNKLW